MTLFLLVKVGSKSSQTIELNIFHVYMMKISIFYQRKHPDTNTSTLNKKDQKEPNLVKKKLFLFKLRVTTGDAELILTLNNYYETCYNWKVLLILPMLD